MLLRHRCALLVAVVEPGVDEARGRPAVRRQKRRSCVEQQNGGQNRTASEAPHLSPHRVFEDHPTSSRRKLQVSSFSLAPSAPPPLSIHSIYSTPSSAPGLGHRCCHTTVSRVWLLRRAADSHSSCPLRAPPSALSPHLHLHVHIHIHIHRHRPSLSPLVSELCQPLLLRLHLHLPAKPPPMLFARRLKHHRLLRLGLCDERGLCTRRVRSARGRV